MGARIKRLTAAATVALFLCAAAPAGAAAPDLPGHTPVHSGASAAKALSAGQLKRALARKLRKAGGIGGAWVKDLTAGRVVFASLDRRRLALASNMKLFTTGTAITRLGGDETLETTAWALGELDDQGVLHGRLLLRGAGDPTMSGRRLAKLAARVKANGVRRVTGGLRFDSSIFDRRTGVPSAGVSGGPYLGSLSGLSVNYGFNRKGNLLKDPAKTAAQLFVQALRRRDLRVPGKPRRKKLAAGVPDSARIAMVSSPTMRELIAATNQPSDNFLAEMLTKLVGARLGGGGTTATGVRVIHSFARAHDAGVSGQNGSGLSVKDRASPRAVGRFLESMRAEEDPIADAFISSLAVAGRNGTLADRMRGTAAQGRCRGKTGTLTAVSALSGYCTAPGGRVMAFSILINRVDIEAAHFAQDKMAALIARYRP